MNALQNMISYLTLKLAEQGVTEEKFMSPTER